MFLINDLYLRCYELILDVRVSIRFVYRRVSSSIPVNAVFLVTVGLFFSV